MKKLLSVVAIGGMMVSMYVGQAFALSTSDVTLDGNDADYAYGVYGGNDTLGEVNGLNTAAFGNGPFQLLDKTDSSSTPIGTTTFTIASNLESKSFTLSWIDTNIPPTKWFDLVFALKAATSYSYYLFDNVEFSSAPGKYDGEYVITWQNNGGQTPDLSHISVYGRPGNPIPEPATMLLFGVGLAGLAGIARRKVQ